MGRLFWKFFFFFFLAQLTSVIGVGLAIWLLHNPREDIANTAIESSHPAISVVEAASATLEYGGVDSLKKLLRAWEARHVPQVYAINELGLDLMQRVLPDSTIKAAMDIQESSDWQGAVSEVAASDGHRYLLFVPTPNAHGMPLKGVHWNTGLNNPPADNLLPDGLPPDGHADGISPPRHGQHRFFPMMPLLAGVFASLIFAALLAWYFSKPIKYLRAAFEEAAAGHLDTRVGAAIGSRRDELADLGRDFDLMAKRLGALMAAQTKLLHHVSHELRSPLARLQIAIDLARQNPEKITASHERIEREANRMDLLVGDLLALSRLDAAAVKMDKKNIDIVELLTSVVEDARFESGRQHIEIELRIRAAFTVVGQADMLHRAVENVVRNAIKYSPEAGSVTVELNESVPQRCLLISIRDQGTGVHDDELEKIFEPFVRSRDVQQSYGHGVGLAITRQAVEAHGGKVIANNLTPTGFVVEIRLPYVAMRVLPDNELA